MFPVAISAGNTLIIKPSEKIPGAAMILARLTASAGLPPCVLNIVHGTVDAVTSHVIVPQSKAFSLLVRLVLARMFGGAVPQSASVL